MPKTGTLLHLQREMGVLYMSNGCRTHSTGTTTGDWNLSTPSTETAKQSLIMKREGLSFPKELGRKKGKLK